MPTRFDIRFFQKDAEEYSLFAPMFKEKAISNAAERGMLIAGVEYSQGSDQMASGERVKGS